MWTLLGEECGDRFDFYLEKIIYSSWSKSNELPVRARIQLGTGWSARDVKEEFFGVVRHGTEQLLIAHLLGKLDAFDGIRL